MISRIDHVSIAVKDREKAEHFFRDILGAVSCTGADNAASGFFWRLFAMGDLSRLELISPTTEGGMLDGFLKSREGGVHHITLQTPDLRGAMACLRKHGIPFFGHHEYPGGIWKEIFIHPRDAFGVLIQIAEFEPSDWLSDEVKLTAETRWRVEKKESGATIVFRHPGGGKVSLELGRSELKQLAAMLAEAAAPDDPGS